MPAAFLNSNKDFNLKMLHGPRISRSRFFLLKNRDYTNKKVYTLKNSVQLTHCFAHFCSNHDFKEKKLLQ